MFALFSVPSLIVFILLEIYALMIDKYRRVRYVLFAIFFFFIWYVIAWLIESQLDLAALLPAPVPTILLAIILLSGSVLSLNVLKATS